MATISVGNIKFNWKGPWSSSTTYAVDDVVSLSGSSYISIQAGSNQNPASASAYWQQMSSAGTNGTDGTDLTSTLSTRGDLVFKGASALERLPKGTAGYYLKQGANDPEWAEVSSGSTLQTVRASSTNVVGSTNDLSSYTQNLTTSNGVLALSCSITPQSAGSSHFYIHAQARHGVSGNSMGGTGLFHGSTLIAGSMAACYSSDNDNASVFAFIDTNGLSGSQTFQFRNLGARSGNNSYLNGNHGGSVAGNGIGNNNTRMHMTVQEIKN